MKTQAIVATVILLVHHTFAVMHGDAHTNIPLLLSSFQNMFVYGVILLLPILAIVLMWTRFSTFGLRILLFSMVGSLIFDIYHHYILVSPDNIAHLPAAPAELHTQFIWTAHALTLAQVVGVIVAFWFLRGRETAAA